MKNKEQSIVPAVIVFVMVLAICMLVIGGAVCSDGWGSGSIGRRGACSGHGGVRHWPGIIALIFSTVVALKFHEFLANRKSKPASRDRGEASRSFSSDGAPRLVAEVSETTDGTRPRRRTRTYTQCPRCRSKMVLRTAKQGRNTGGKFWGCSKYPRCKGTRKYQPENPNNAQEADGSEAPRI